MLVATRTAASILFAVLLSATNASAGTTGMLSGFIRDSQGNGIPGVQVKVFSAQQSSLATTDAHGFYVFLSLAPDVYGLNVWKDGYDASTGRVLDVRSDETTYYPIELRKACKCDGRVIRVWNTKIDVGSQDVYDVPRFLIEHQIP